MSARTIWLTIGLLLCAACGSAAPGQATAPTPATSATSAGSPGPGAPAPSGRPAPSPTGSRLASTGHVPAGAATATVTVGGTTTMIEHGSCQVLPEGFVIAVGASFYPIDPPLPDFFGLTIEGAGADGSYSGDALTGPLIVVGQKEFAMGTAGKVSLSGGLTSGTFEGPIEHGAGTIAGTFDCG
jgi:hypothetical protein